jgi:hypothetical protein
VYSGQTGFAQGHLISIFLNFLKLFVKMRLAISLTGVQISYFLDLRIKCYGCLKFLGEVCAGWACARADEEELTTCAIFLGQEEVGKI